MEIGHQNKIGLMSHQKLTKGCEFGLFLDWVWDWVGLVIQKIVTTKNPNYFQSYQLFRAGGLPNAPIGSPAHEQPIGIRLSEVSEFA